FYLYYIKNYRIRKVVSSGADHNLRGQDKVKEVNTRRRQDDRRTRNKSPIRNESSRLERKRGEDSGRSKLREVPEKKREKKEVLGDELTRDQQQSRQKDSEIANGGFGSVSGFGDIGFSNTGFSNTNFTDSGSHKNMDENKRIGTQVKPRILAPNTNGGKGDTGESQGMPTAPKITVNELSAESIKREPPTKGPNQRRLLSNAGSFGMKRQHAGFRGGATFIGATRVQQQKHGRTFDGINPNSKMIQPNEKLERGKFENEQALVPRGRNYFIHDHRDAKFGNQRNQSNVRFGKERNPVGWRNFGNEEGPIEKLNLATQAYGRGGGWSARGGFAKFGSLRSKADEDLIWKHDKYVEVSQDEANTKLELIDEVGVESQQGIFDMSRPQEGESRHRYQEECLDYEVEELSVYD
ncbi:Btz domain-containing protein, partial [Meloidogyne graminicola]